MKQQNYVCLSDLQCIETTTPTLEQSMLGVIVRAVYGGFPKLGAPFWGPNNKGYSILGSILGSPYFGKLPYMYI